MAREPQHRGMQDKWGERILKNGWTGIPTILLDSQATLKLTPLDMLVLVHLIRWWWIKDRWPFPELDRVARSIGVDGAKVKVSIGKLRVQRLVRPLRLQSGRTAYDLTGLLDRLEEEVIARLGN